MWAIVLAVLMAPFHRRFCSKKNPNIGAAITTLSAIFIVVLPLALVSTILVSEVSGYARNLKENAPPAGGEYTPEFFFTEADKIIQPLAERLGNKEFSAQGWFDQNKDQLSKQAGAFAFGTIKGIGIGAFTLVVAFLTLFFLIRDSHRLKQPAKELIPLPHDRSEAVLERMGKTIQAVFIGVVMVAVIQGLLAGAAYWALGVPSPIVWCFVTMILCAIPLLGAPVVYVPLSIILMAQGNWAGGIGLAAWGFIVISNVDNFLRPFIIGSRVQLHPMAVFFALLGGVFALGPVGLMAGPVLLTVALALQDIVREKMSMEKAISGPVPAD
jgi:predicted PurR-regulated permease PerM